MENKKGWSWMGFLFAPHYYAGYGQLKKGLALAVISGIMPLVAIAVGIYGGLKARKELPIKEVAFNWKNVALTSITLIVVSLISLTVISGMKENSSSSTEISSASESVSGNGQAMALTEENMKAYGEKAGETIKDILDVDDIAGANTQLLSLADKKKIAKGTLEDMGYDYDATILNAIKENHSTGKESYKVDFLIPQGMEVEEAIKIGFISSDTAKKLEIYNQYKDMKDIPTTVKLCNIVIECENMSKGVCNGANLKKLLDKNFNIVKSVSSGYRDVFLAYDPTKESNGQDGKTPLFKCNDGYGDGSVNDCIDRDGSDNNIITLNKDIYNQLQNESKSIWWQ